MVWDFGAWRGVLSAEEDGVWCPGFGCALCEANTGRQQSLTLTFCLHEAIGRPAKMASALNNTL